MSIEADDLTALRDWIAAIGHRVPEALERVRPAALAGGRVTPRDAVGAALDKESIVLRRLRPVLAIKEGTTTLQFKDIEDGRLWREPLEQAKEILDVAIPAVGRIELVNSEYDWAGTGYLVAEDILVTNRHVAELFAHRRGEGFAFNTGPKGEVVAAVDFLEEDGSSEELVFKIKRPLFIEEPNGPDLAFFEVDLQSGSNTLANHLTLAKRPSHSDKVAVIGYPAFDSRIPKRDLMDRIYGKLYDKKRLAPGTVTDLNEHQVVHDCTTLGGCSGSPVYDLRSGEVIGLHFSGAFLTANYAVRSDIVENAKSHARAGILRPYPIRRDPTTDSLGAGVAQFSVASGTGISIPLTINILVGTPTVIQPSAPASRPPSPHLGSAVDGDEVATEGRAGDYRNRDGYDSGFLGAGAAVALPRVIENTDEVLTFSDRGKQTSELLYQHFSVVMNRPRRLCFFSAVNIDGALSQKTKRPGWRTDPRIPLDMQVIGECYGDPPKFSRGHMTRREDPAWGANEDEAKLGNADSMHVTNAVPQYQAFNSPIWLELEDYALQNAREDDMKISVFTGPFFKPEDPVYHGVQVPISFWKVIAFIHDKTGKLCATGYKMSQQASLPEPEFVFGDLKSKYLNVSTQEPLRAIEEEAGISFGELTAYDPLRSVAEARPHPTLLTRIEQIRFF